MSHPTVACGCGRTMNLDPLRGKDAYRCGCGVRVKLAIPDTPRCAGYHDSNRCRSGVAAGIPVDLCPEHAENLRALWRLDLTVKQRAEDESRFGSETMERLDRYHLTPQDPDRNRAAWLGMSLAMRSPDAHAPIVYYLRFGDRIKIGTTRNLPKRLAAVPHDEVLATELGDFQVEGSRHRQFQHLRIKGEWFQPAQDLLDHIEGVRQGADGQNGRPGVASPHHR